MKRTAVVLLIAAFLLLGAGINLVYNALHEKEEEITAPVVTAAPEPTQAPTPEPTLSPTFTPIPVTTPTPRPAPTFTPVPVTPAPTPTPVISYSASGSARSNTGTALNLILDWSVSSRGDGSYDLTMKVSAEHYALFSSENYGNLAYNVNGSVIYGTSQAISQETNNYAVDYLDARTVQVYGGQSVYVSVDWYFRGSYSGQYIESIRAETTIQIP